MALIVYDMGRRIETPASKTKRKIRTAASSKTGKISEHLPFSETEQQHAIESYQSERPQHTPKAVSYLYEIMSSNIVTLPEDATVADAWDIFSHSSFHQLPIVDHQQTPIAMLSKNSISQGPDANTSITRLAAMSFANSQVFCFTEKTDIRQAARILDEYKLAALPIVNEKNQLIGLVTRTDIIRLISHYGPMELWA